LFVDFLSVPNATISVWRALCERSARYPIAGYRDAPGKGMEGEVKGRTRNGWSGRGQGEKGVGCGIPKNSFKKPCTFMCRFVLWRYDR